MLQFFIYLVLTEKTQTQLIRNSSRARRDIRTGSRIANKRFQKCVSRKNDSQLTRRVFEVFLNVNDIARDKGREESRWKEKMGRVSPLRESSFLRERERKKERSERSIF